MIEADEVEDVRQATAGWCTAGQTTALVPTMGYLHEGHLSLVRLARRRADRVVVSIFVNPTQFGPGEDLDRYPRDVERDRRMLEEEGVDLLFLPTREVMYPEPFVTSIEVGSVSRGLCGELRPGHFRGVATIVTKLFGVVQPDIAVFGKKDAQQLAVIRSLGRDLNLPIEILGGEIVREPDGLALSSRNTFLSATERRDALALSCALAWTRDELDSPEVDLGDLAGRLRKRLESAPGLRLEYAEIVDADTIEPLTGPVRALPAPTTRILIAIAAFAGQTRLIDNLDLERPE